MKKLLALLLLFGIVGCVSSRDIRTERLEHEQKIETTEYKLEELRDEDYGYEYIGEWKDDNRNGQGTYTWADGRKYVGEFKDGKVNGQGTLIMADGRKYVGEFKDSNFNGQGTFIMADGSKYVGEFKDGKINGQGTLTWADGRKYVGEWKDGKFNGQGTFTHADGLQDTGVWKNNRLRKERVLSAAECYETRFIEVQRLGEIYKIQQREFRYLPVDAVQNITDRYLENVRNAEAEYELCKKGMKVFYYGAAVKL